MEISINTKVLSSALQKIMSVASAKSFNAYAKAVRIFTDNNGNLKLSAYNGRLANVITLPVVLPTPLDLYADASLFNDIVKANVDVEVVTLDIGSNTLKFIAGRGKYNVALLACDTPPDIQTVSTKQQVRLSVENAQLIADMYSIASKDDYLPKLTGVYLDMTGAPYAVATDKYKLVMRKLQLDVEDCAGESPLALTAILPKELQIILRQITDEATVKINNDLISIQYADTYIVSSLIIEKYPDVLAVIPAAETFAANVPLKPLLSCIKKVAILSDKINEKVKIVANNTSLTFSTYDNSGNTAVDIIDIAEETVVPDNTFTISFNIGYLQDVLSLMKDEVVKVSFLAINKPITITGDANDNTLALLTPMVN